MTAPPRPLLPKGRRRPAALLGVAAVLAAGVATAVSLNVGWQRDEGPPAALAAPGGRLVTAAPPGSVSLPQPPYRAATTTHGKRHTRRPAARPVRIAIPAIGVRARVIRLGLNADRSLQVPRNFADTGWWSGGARPGDPGPAVVVGHVDSTTGPAVYYRLPKLRRGDRITITRADRTVVTFAVQRLQRFPKAHFPTKQVYGVTAGSTLRLITCSGTFDRSSGHYLDNTIVFAKLVARR